MPISARTMLEAGFQSQGFLTRKRYTVQYKLMTVSEEASVMRKQFLNLFP